MANQMYHYKHSYGGITFVGFNDKAKVYSVDYYANVGANTEESKPVKLTVVKQLITSCIEMGFKRVTRLPNE